MESWRNEFYASDYGSQYLMHYRTKGSKNGVSRTEGYRAVGQLAKGPLLSVTKISTTSKRPVSRERDVDPTITGTVGRRGSSLPLGETAGNFKPTGPNGLNESYAANRPTTQPSGKSPYIMSDDKINQDYIDSKIQKAGGIPNDIQWVMNVARIDEVLASKSDREALVNSLITDDKWFAGAVSTLGEKNAKATINKYLDDYLSVEPNGLTTEQAAKLKEQSEQKAAEKKPTPSPLKKPVKVALLEERNRDLGERADQERLKKLAAQRAIDAIKNEKIGSVLKDYAGIVGDTMKLMAKGTLAGYASMLPGKNDAARVIGESVQKDAQKLGQRIGTRIVKNKIRKGK